MARAAARKLVSCQLPHTPGTPKEGAPMSSSRPYFDSHPMPPPGIRLTTHNDRGYLRCQWHIKGKQYHIQQHVYIWQLNFGPLPQGYVVHHVDGNRSNNSLGNLRAMANGDHIRLHSTIHGIYCGSRPGQWSYVRTKHLVERLRRERLYRESHREYCREQNRLYRLRCKLRCKSES